MFLKDRLWFELRVSKPVHVYVINRDDEGRAFALFPLPQFSLQNPVPANQWLRIPGDVNGEQRSWYVDTPGGREDLLILVSPEPQPEFEKQMARLDRPEDLGIAIEDLSDLPVRGIGALVPARPSDNPAGSAARLFDLAEEIAGHEAESAEGVWFRKIQLVNPG